MKKLLLRLLIVPFMLSIVSFVYTANAADDAKEYRRLRKAEKARRNADKEISARKRRDYKRDLAAATDTTRHLEWYAAVCNERTERKALMENWNTLYAQSRDSDEAAGKLAYLYKEPAWPTSALFFEGKKDYLRVTANYRYATDSFGASGVSGDISRLAFGDTPITVQDALLLSKLVKAGTVLQDDKIVTLSHATAADTYLNYLSQAVFNFNGRAEQYGVSIDFSRYIANHAVAIGFELPILNKKHFLKLETELPDAAQLGNQGDGAFGFGSQSGSNSPDGTPNAFLRRYGADPLRFLTDVLRAKGINELGGSAMGLGDVAIFINGQFNSARYDKLILGLRIQFPTGTKAATQKLWAPELGNGGFCEMAAYSSILFNYKKYLNPHALGVLSVGMPAHINRRVPRRITMEAPEVKGSLKNALNADQQIAFADRAQTIDGKAFDDYDTTIKGFADEATSVKMSKGVEFKFRLGNMFERFISAFGFLDMFYDFRGKLRDSVNGLNRDEYNVNVLTNGTAELEHRVGLDYTYQYDLFTRLRIGACYTFAGMNVPKTFELSGSLSYAF